MPHVLLLFKIYHFIDRKSYFMVRINNSTLYRCYCIPFTLDHLDHIENNNNSYDQIRLDRLDRLDNLTRELIGTLRIHLSGALRRLKERQ